MDHGPFAILKGNAMGSRSNIRHQSLIEKLKKHQKKKKTKETLDAPSSGWDGAHPSTCAIIVMHHGPFPI